MFSAQRQKIWQFHDHLRSLLGQMEGDIVSLRESGFDLKMMKMYLQAYRTLRELFRTFNKDKPYEMAEKFVQFVLSRHSGAVLDNLDFLIQHHLGTGHFSVLNTLKELAVRVKHLITTSPHIPGSSDPPPPPARPTVIAPEDHTPGEPLDVTNPAIPSAKKK